MSFWYLQLSQKTNEKKSSLLLWYSRIVFVRFSGELKTPKDILNELTFIKKPSLAPRIREIIVDGQLSELRVGKRRQFGTPSRALSPKNGRPPLWPASKGYE